MAETYSINQFCKELGRSPQVVRSLQSHLELHIPKKEESYSHAYLNFMHQVIALRTFCVPLEDIADLLRKEKKILELLHVDSFSDSPTWYLDACRGDPQPNGSQLLLTGHDLGFPLTAEVIQSNLDFRERNPELFTSAEIGEDVRNVLRTYLKLLDKIKGRIRMEKPIIERALFWSEQAFW